MQACDFDDIDTAAIATDHRRHLAPELPAPIERGADRGAVVAFQKFDLTIDDIIDFAPVHCLNIGGVDPEKPAVAVPQPGRLGDGVEHAAHLGKHGFHRSALVPEARHGELFAGQHAHHHHGAPGDGPALDLDMVARKRFCGEGEGNPLLTQPKGLTIEPLSQLSGQPFGKGQQALRGIGFDQYARITFDLGGTRRPTPDDHHLPVGGEKGRETFDLRLAFLQRAVVLLRVLVPLPPGTDMQDGNGRGIDRHHHQREPERDGHAGNVKLAGAEARQAQRETFLRDCRARQKGRDARQHSMRDRGHAKASHSAPPPSRCRHIPGLPALTRHRRATQDANHLKPQPGATLSRPRVRLEVVNKEITRPFFSNGRVGLWIIRRR